MVGVTLSMALILTGCGQAYAPIAKVSQQNMVNKVDSKQLAKAKRIVEEKIKQRSISAQSLNPAMDSTSNLRTGITHTAAWTGFFIAAGSFNA